MATPLSRCFVLACALALSLSACNDTVEGEGGGLEEDPNNDPNNQPNNEPNNDPPPNNDPNNQPNNDSPPNNEPNNQPNNDPNNGPSCGDIEASYEDLVGGAQGCEADEDCRIVSGQCGVGLGGCYESVNASLVDGELEALGRVYSGQGCTMGVCDCDIAPPAACKEGVCDFGEFCPGRTLGEVWVEACNECVCTEEGPVCTDEECNACEDIEARYRGLVESASDCSDHGDCQTISGQCGVGLGGCYESVNQSLSQDDLSELGLIYSEGGCTGAVCRCTPPPPSRCDAGACVLTSCEDIGDAYAALVNEATSCREDGDCQVLNGQCGVGLGGCYEVVNRSLSQGDLSGLGRLFSSADCTQAVCDCAPPPQALCRESVCVGLFED